MAKATPKKNATTANLGYEARLWQTADALRNNMDATEYKHVVLGVIFLKYISDAFEAKHAELESQRAQGADPEDPDEYRAVNIFWVPREARWSHLKANAPQPTIGALVDDAMAAIERAMSRRRSSVGHWRRVDCCRSHSATLGTRLAHFMSVGVVRETLQPTPAAWPRSAASRRSSPAGAILGTRCMAWRRSRASRRGARDA